MFKKRNLLNNRRNEKATPSQKVILIVLILIAFLLGYSIYTQRINNSTSSPSTTQQLNNQAPSMPKATANSMEDDIRKILNPPAAQSSKSAREEHAALVAKLAEPNSTLDVTNCHASPVVLEVKEGTEFQITNQGSNSTQIVFDSNHTYKIPANGNIKVKASFKYGSGDYGYICNGDSIIGFVHIVP